VTTRAEFLRELDGDIAAAFVDLGACSVGSYTPRATGILVEPVRMYVDESPEEGSTATPVALLEDSVRITLLRPDVVSRPRKGDLIVCEGETYEVSKLESHDAGNWVVLCPA
jgi:hypothetical protein